MSPGPILALRNKSLLQQILPVLGWIGACLTIGAVCLLAWLNGGPPGTFKQNVDWMASQTEIVDMLKERLNLGSAITSISVLHGADIIAAINHPAREDLLAILEPGGQIRGLLLLKIVIRVRPIVVLAVVLGSLAAIITGLVNLGRLINQSHYLLGLMKALSCIMVISLTILVTYIPSLDTFGQVDNFGLRLLAAMAELEVGDGGWWMLLGLGLTIVSTFGDWVPTLVLKTLSLDDNQSEFL